MHTRWDYYDSGTRVIDHRHESRQVHVNDVVIQPLIHGTSVQVRLREDKPRNTNLQGII
jgi:Asp-tRNA(Asn)/Glu-tRNA(Gln) amidotransferase C subunit